MILLLLSLVFADEVVVKVEAGQTVKATRESWLLPAPMFDRCLSNSLALEETQTRLEEKSAELLEAQRTGREALDSCSAATGNLTNENLVLRTELSRARTQRAGLLVGGSILVAIVAVETAALVQLATKTP